MTICRATVTLPYVTNIPRDVATNTFWFDITLPDDLEDVADRLVNFYNVPVPPATYGLHRYLSQHISRSTNACTIEIYALTDPEPRIPRLTRQWTLAVSQASANLPNEVSLCASFQAPTSSGIPQARRRGRVYLGPFITAVNGSAGTDPGRPSEELITAANEACNRLAEGNEPGQIWGVWSRVGESFAEVTNGWVNNEWDTQRRRQPSPTSRANWSIST